MQRTRNVLIKTNIIIIKQHLLRYFFKFILQLLEFKNFSNKEIKNS